MKKLFALFFALAFGVTTLAQDAPKMSVRSFTLAENDNTANLHGTTVIDQNGDPCALIRVQTTQTGFAWDFGQMQPCKVEQKTGEVWLYVPYGVKRVTVRHAQLGTMTYEFPIPVAKARTYVMDLVAANVTVIVEQEITQQYVVFKVTPSNALVELDGQMLETRNGSANKFVKFGKYPYTVTAKDYHPVSGEVEVKDAQSSTVVNVELKPAFGTLSFQISTSLNGAAVFVDNEQVGTVPFVSEVRIPSGKHSLKIIKQKYKSYTDVFEIADGQNLTLSPELEPNFATVTVSTLEGAEIVANGVVLGKAPWTGRLEYDTYSFEIRKPSHRTVYRTMEFFEGAPTQIALPEPLPIYGSLNVICDDGTAVVELDGEIVGETPCFLPKVLIGDHSVSLSAAGYQKSTRTVTVQENTMESLELALVKSAPAPSPSYNSYTYSSDRPYSSSPRLKKNLFKVGTGILTLTDGNGIGDVFHMYSFSTGYKHYFIKKHLGFAVGADFCYSMRNRFNGSDYSNIAVTVPVDLVLKFGSIRMYGGYCFGCNFAEGRTEGFSMNLIHTSPNGGWSNSDPPLVLRMMDGYRAGIQYDFRNGFCVGYSITGNIRSLSVGSSVWSDVSNQWEDYTMNMMSHMIYVGLLF